MSGEPPGHLTQAELAAILAAAQGEEAVLIGGQAIAIWAQRYTDRFPRAIEPITSADVDFFGSALKAKMVASRLQNAQVYLPVPFEDLTPNSAMVRAVVGAHSVTIDFMGQIVWVDSGDITGRFLTLVKWTPFVGPRTVHIKVESRLPLPSFFFENPLSRFLLLF